MLLQQQERRIAGQRPAPDEMDVDMEGNVPVEFPSSPGSANEENKSPAQPSVGHSADPSPTLLPTDPLPASADPTPASAPPAPASSALVAPGVFLQPPTPHTSQEATNVVPEPGPSTSAQRLQPRPRPVRGSRGGSPISLVTSERLLPHGRVQTRSRSRSAVNPGDDPSVSPTESETSRMKRKALPDEHEHEGKRRK